MGCAYGNYIQLAIFFAVMVLQYTNARSIPRSMMRRGTLEENDATVVPVVYQRLMPVTYKDDSDMTTEQSVSQRVATDADNATEVR